MNLQRHKEFLTFNIGYTFHASFMRDFNWECAKYPMIICGLLIITYVIDTAIHEKIRKNRTI